MNKNPTRKRKISPSRDRSPSRNLPQDTVVLELLLDARIVPVENRNSSTTDRKSTRLNSSHLVISYAVFCLKKKKKYKYITLYILILYTRSSAFDPYFSRLQFSTFTLLLALVSTTNLRLTCHFFTFLPITKL